MIIKEVHEHSLRQSERGERERETDRQRQKRADTERSKITNEGLDAEGFGKSENT